jgi:hypothetical protein
MRTLGKLVLVLAVVVAIGAGVYLGGKSLWGGASERSVTTAKANLLQAQLKTLRDLGSTRESTLKSARSELTNATRAATDRERDFYLALVDGYLKMLADQQSAETEALANISKSLLSHPVDQKEYDEMKSTLEALAAQEFETVTKTRADLLRKYRK